LEGIETITDYFAVILNDFKKRGHDLLDTAYNKFDRDWVEFNVDISRLDQELQKFIDDNF
jgi:dynein heavy chain